MVYATHRDIDRNTRILCSPSPLGLLLCLTVTEYRQYDFIKVLAMTTQFFSCIVAGNWKKNLFDDVHEWFMLFPLPIVDMFGYLFSFFFSAQTSPAALEMMSIKRLMLKGLLIQIQKLCLQQENGCFFFLSCPCISAIFSLPKPSHQLCVMVQVLD